MGGFELQLLEKYIPQEIKHKVGTYLDFCNHQGNTKAPFVTVNKIIIQNTTIAKILTAIEVELK